MCIRDSLMILTERTAQITSKAPDRQNHISSHKPPERLLFHRVQRHRGNPSIIPTDDITLLIFSGTASSDLPLFQYTAVHTRRTYFLHTATCFLCPFGFSHLQPVSYTHLDVYKRQGILILRHILISLL